ncbi:hypothetical protein PPERSA_09325 [Pseudocohnilembus persalinus]|uniref:Uncharacterized protein n=1 Tax=Pseudocohnilembus persalinus TaxID=266149 RepID=A0A0V0QXV6_PSEPJ|nr:hypothetical protein PPERSA_09325 [Pseudocohnilembus persalinus]|eukprot:KRX07111.1 hypothetical protein PPERSA_09325 [Pseudocohnilembus persalinus]
MRINPEKDIKRAKQNLDQLIQELFILGESLLEESEAKYLNFIICRQSLDEIAKYTTFFNTLKNYQKMATIRREEKEKRESLQDQNFPLDIFDRLFQTGFQIFVQSDLDKNIIRQIKEIFVRQVSKIQEKLAQQKKQFPNKTFLKFDQKMQEFKELLPLFLINTINANIRFNKIEDFQEVFGLNEYLHTNPYKPSKILKTKAPYKFKNLIQDLPILKDILNFFINYCLFNFQIQVFLDEKVYTQLDVQDKKGAYKFFQQFFDKY